LTRCELEVEQEASELVMQQRAETQSSLRGLRAVLESLARLEGPKSVILISEGLVLEGSTNEVDAVASLAGDVRASLDVLLLDVPPFDVTQSQRPTTPREDRDLQVAGLESMAAMSRGTLHRIPAGADNAFARINRSLAGHYILGIEARPKDRDGRRHRISVRSSRRGLTINSRRGFLASTSPAATTPADAVAKALRAPLPLADMPVRLATFTYKEPGTARVRLLIAAEIERLANQSLDYTSGIIVVEQSGQVVASAVDARTLSPHPLDAGSALYSGLVTVDPGSYLVRLAFADSEGRIASVERRVTAFQMDGTDVSVGDLIVGAPPATGGGTLVPSVEPRVQGSLVALMEVYGSGDGTLEAVQGTLDVVRGESERPLMSTAMQRAAGSSPEARSLQAEIRTGALPPGRYLARATITQGGQPKGHIIRPFRVLAARGAAENGAGEAVAAVPGGAVPPEIRKALIDSLPAFDRNELLEKHVLSSVLTAAQEGRPAAVKAAIDGARQGRVGPAALAALEAGDQPMASFLRGLDLFAQVQSDRAAQQLQTSMQMAPSFAPARLYLGALLAEGRRYREAASLLQSVPASLVPSGTVSRLAGEAWLRAGDPSLARGLQLAQPLDPA
ncbi:MAG: hypothetical protein LC791_02490, partial [Acidobacteria bacterium]|nr:hypothetical protein [Acidobacteriota bacterium]